VGYTTCDGCPGGNVEYAPAEMKKNGAEAVHLATGLLVGYPPCPYIDDFRIETHDVLGTWTGSEWQSRLQETLTDEETRRSYD